VSRRSQQTRAWVLALLAGMVASELGAQGAGQIPDPTRPPDALPESVETSEAPAAGARRLTAIVISPTRRVAVVDGVTVRVGDAVGHARVSAIEPLEVRLSGADGEVVLSIAGPPVKAEVTP
jgi:MSHA biogenesis protein MshK